MNVFHFIQMKPTKTYLSLIDPQKKTRFVCFSNKNTADVFVNYVTSFRSKHGYWPVMDMSQKFKTVKSLTGIKKRTPDELREYLTYEIFDFEQIDEMSRRANISYLHVTDFTYIPNGEDNQVISFSGQEWDGCADDLKYRDLLEFNLKIK
jgi:hypothetical protein